MDNIGIYCLYFKELDDKFYIGYSTNINKRINDHISQLMLNKHSNEKLQSAYNKYGKPIFEVLEYCDSKFLTEKEIYWIEQFDSFNNGFNLTNGGDGGFGEGNSQASHKEEIYRKILIELAYTSKPYSLIANELNTTIGIIKNIAALNSHNYLKDLMPREYQIICDKLNTRKISAKYQGINYPIIKDINGKEYTVDNIHKFAEEHGLQYQNLHKVLTGKRKTHKGWELK